MQNTTESNEPSSNETSEILEEVQAEKVQEPSIDLIALLTQLLPPLAPIIESWNKEARLLEIIRMLATPVIWGTIIILGMCLTFDIADKLLTAGHATEATGLVDKVLSFLLGAVGGMGIMGMRKGR